MYIGVPKEIKNHEYRVGLTPNSVKELTKHGHTVFVETKAGDAIGLSDEKYDAAGAKIVSSAEKVYSEAEMIVKVKEPQPNEYGLIKEDQILFTYLHLAPDRKQTEGLLASKCIGIAYETVIDRHGRLPLLAPMSEVAGRLSVQAGAHCLEKAQGGCGILLGGVPGVSPAYVLIIGGGVVGTQAAQMALGLGARVTVLDKSLDRLRYLDDLFQGNVETLYSTEANIEGRLLHADLVIGGVLAAGAEAPKVVTREMLKMMKPHSVIVDVAIDQGGCFETSHATTHQNPTFIEEQVIHYCVANMPGAVPLTSTFALNNATLPFVIRLANKGYKAALLEDACFLPGLNVYKGQLTNEPVANALSKMFMDPQTILAA